jgi:hypothetical protein
MSEHSAVTGKTPMAGAQKTIAKCQWGWPVGSFFTCRRVVSGLRPFADRALERESSPNDNHGERLRFVSTMDLPRLGLNLPAMQCDEVQTWIPREWADA